MFELGNLFVAMASNIEAPPVLKEEDDFLSWKNDIEVWQLFTDMEAEKQGPAVYLTLTGRAREGVCGLLPADLGKNDGLKKILDKLDSIFLQDANTRAYLAFKEFYEYKRSPGQLFSDFIVNFDRLYSKIMKHDMKLPEPVRAYFLLNAVNMSEDNEKLARTTCGDLTYDNMKDKIMKIFGDPTYSENNRCVVPVKQECFVSYKNQGQKYNRQRFRGGFKNHQNRYESGEKKERNIENLKDEDS